MWHLLCGMPRKRTPVCVTSTGLVQEEARKIDPNNKEARFIARNHADLHMKRFASNAIHTGKYDRLFITFIPVFLWDTFTRVAYLYFLAQVRHFWAHDLH